MCGVTISARAADTTLTLAQTLLCMGLILICPIIAQLTVQIILFNYPFTLGTSLDFVPDLSSSDTYFMIDGANFTLGSGVMKSY